MRRYFVAVVAILILIAGATSPGIGQPRTNSPAVLQEVKDVVTSTVIPVTWRNAANPDTVLRLFTAAAQVYDTTREAIPIWGANTISLQNSFTHAEDSALVKVYVQVSNDGSNWGYFPQPALALDTTGVNAADSSGAWDTAGTITHVVNIATPPTYARYMRLISRKLASAATDTMKLRTWVHVIKNDE